MLNFISIVRGRFGQVPGFSASLFAFLFVKMGSDDVIASAPVEEKSVRTTGIPFISVARWKLGLMRLNCTTS